MDALISIRGFSPSSNNPPGDEGEGRDFTRTVSADSDDGTVAGDYLLVIASVDFVSSLTIEDTSGVDDWLQLVGSNDGSYMRTAAWLGRVTSNGAKRVSCRQNGSSSFYVQVWTLDASGWEITRDGGTSTTRGRSRPYNLGSITVSGDRSLLVGYHAAVQFSSSDMDYDGGVPSGMTVGVEHYVNNWSAQISAYEFLDDDGSTGGRSFTSQLSTLQDGGGAGALFALRAKPTYVSLAPTAGQVPVTGPTPNVELVDPNVHTHPAAGPVGVTGPAPALLENAHPPAGAVTLSGPTPSVAIVVGTEPGIIRVSGPDAFAGGLSPQPGSVRVLGPAPQLAFGGQDAGSRIYEVPLPPPPPARVIAQNIRTGEFLHWDLPVDELEITWTLSGPQTISGRFPTEIRDLADLNLEPYGTWIHVEEDGLIRASGILQPGGVNQQETLKLDAAGVSSFAHGQPYLRDFTLSGTYPPTGESGIGVGLDPADIVRNIWAEIQNYPDGDLGVTVVGSTDLRIGEPPRDVDFETSEGEAVSFIAGPYSKLDWWEHADCGAEIDRLAKEGPWDYVERQAWNADRTSVEHWIEIGWPRLGRRHETVRLAQDDNLLAAIGPEEPDDRYASMVVVLGAGEGSARVRGSASRAVGTRLRRVKTIDDKTVKSTTEANARARTELDASQALQDVTEAKLSAAHPDAPLGSYDVGDDIPLTADVPWVGDVNLLQRILRITWTPRGDSVVLTLRSASSFTYGTTA